MLSGHHFVYPRSRHLQRLERRQYPRPPADARDHPFHLSRQVGASGTTSFTDSVPLTHSVDYYKQYTLTVKGGNAISCSIPSPTNDNYCDVRTKLSARGEGTGSYSGPTNPVTITMNSPVTEMVILSPRAVVRLSLFMSTGGPPATRTVSGCGVSHALTGDGTLDQLVVLPSCAMTISLVNSGSTRYVFADGTSSADFTACVNGYCQPVFLRYYFQNAMQVGYSSVGGPPPVPPTFDYVGFGSTLNVTLSQSPTTIWSDFGTKWSLPQTIQVGGSERWATPSQTTGTVTQPGAISAAYYHSTC
jgi:hypothetical protein